MMNAPQPGFQAQQPTRILGRGLSRLQRAAYFLLVLLLSIMLFLIFNLEIASAVIANGAIKVLKNKAILQHPEGGRIAAVLVTEGQQIASGAAIIELDNPGLKSNYRSLQRQLFSEQVRKQRLAAEIAYPTQFSYPLKGAGDLEQAAIVQTESRLFASRRRNLESQLASIREQAAYLQNEIAALQRATENDRFITRKNQELAQQGFLAPMAVLTHEQTALARHVDLERAQQRLTELKQRSFVLIEDFQNNAATELRACNDRILELEEKMKPVSEAVANLLVRTPTDGVIVNLTRLGQGSVLGPKETIAEVVPTDRSLIVEANLPTDQVAHVRPDTVARVTIQQLRKQLGRELQGKVLTVSADSLSQSALGTWTYLVRIEIQEISRAEADLLQPGMPVEVHIQAARRTIADYLLAPISNYMNRAIREPN